MASGRSLARWVLPFVLMKLVALMVDGAAPAGPVADDPCRIGRNKSVQVLESFKKQIKNQFLLNWSSNNSNSWDRVVWDGDEISGLNLSGLGLRGRLFPLWNDLPSLVYLNLSMNNFSGELHFSALNGCTSLSELDLSSNTLSGQILANISALKSLTFLKLANNSLTGEIPLEIGNLTELRLLDLSNNKLEGKIPLEITYLQNLVTLNLSMNDLRGSLFPQIGNLSKLQYLSLYKNHLNEQIPSDLSRCSELVKIDVSSNNFSGGIPSELGKLSNLTILSAGSNNLTELPYFGSSMFPGLQVLYLPHNKISGAIPNLAGMKSLKSLMLNDNKFTGSIPETIGNCISLEEIRLDTNNLSGSTPVSIFNISFLETLGLNDNKLEGNIPKEVGNCENLRVLWLENNQFNGSIPEEIGNLSRLLMLSLSNNKITGQIPESLGRLGNLIGLDLGENYFEGTIPSTFASLSSLQFLFLPQTSLSGPIPEFIGSLSSLRLLDLSYNQFSGSIPPALSDLKVFRNESGYSTTPSAYVTGSGLTYIFGNRAPTMIDLSHNLLTGSIPDALGSMKNLQVLNLNNNSLSGQIPAALGNATGLLHLDLSCNNLTGEIPGELAELTFLSYFNVSFNHLSGHIPSTKQFDTFGAASYTGNNLCGGVLGSCSPPFSPVNATRTASKPFGSMIVKLLPLYIFLCGIAGFCIFWVIFFFVVRRRQKLFTNPENNGRKQGFYESAIFSGLIPEEINPKELALATDNYNQANILGDGGFGIVYKAVLDTGCTVAIKKLTADGIQGEREFRAEVHTLGRIKHKNLVPLLGYCSDETDRILIYKFLKNGSLDSWLHCREANMKPLDWPTRLKIARGAAQGLSFLHHDCCPPIIHRDIKVSNILLDEDFEAHVADFGLARLVDAGETHVTTDVAGTVGYIPPEYNHKCIATHRGDVYSFGVVCLEIVTGKRPADGGLRKSGGHLVAWISSLMKTGEEKLAVDSSIADADSIPEILEMMRIAWQCCHDIPSRRPNMRQVEQQLESLERRCLQSRQTVEFLREGNLNQCLEEKNLLNVELITM